MSVIYLWSKIEFIRYVGIFWFFSKKEEFTDFLQGVLEKVQSSLNFFHTLQEHQKFRSKTTISVISDLLICM